MSIAKVIDSNVEDLLNLVPVLPEVVPIKLQSRRASMRDSMDTWKMLCFVYPHLEAIELSLLDEEEKTVTDIFAKMRTNVLRLHSDFVRFNCKRLIFYTRRIFYRPQIEQ